MIGRTGKPYQKLLNTQIAACRPHADKGIRQCGHGNAGEQYFFGQQAVFTVKQHNQPQSKQGRADADEPKHVAEHLHIKQQHRSHHAQSRAGADAEQFGAGHRVLCEPLQKYAGGGEHDAASGSGEEAQVTQIEKIGVKGKLPAVGTFSGQQSQSCRKQQQ